MKSKTSEQSAPPRKSEIAVDHILRTLPEGIEDRKAVLEFIIASPLTDVARFDGAIRGLLAHLSRHSVELRELIQSVEGGQAR